MQIVENGLFGNVLDVFVLIRNSDHVILMHKAAQ